MDFENETFEKASFRSTNRLLFDCRFDSDVRPDDEDVEAVKNQPKGRKWLDLHLDEDVLETLQDDTYGELMKLVPWKSGVCHDFARVLATRDVTLVKAVLGLEAAESVPRDLLSTHCLDILGRGSGGTHRHANTNRSYFSRQLAFLEFLHANETHQSTIETIAKSLSRTSGEIRRLLPRVNRPILLASDKAFVEFLTHIRSGREVHVSERFMIISFRVREPFCILG